MDSYLGIENLSINQGAMEKLGYVLAKLLAPASDDSLSVWLFAAGWQYVKTALCSKFLFILHPL